MKRNVREFYDNIGWSEVAEGQYQNARYDDLRPVAQEYVHQCHLRVNRHLAPEGRYLLDAGSGPIQYPEYLTYSQGYTYRVCADISLTAMKEARKRIGDHGLFIVADIANLPFRKNAFDGIVSLHTIHHLHRDEHIPAYRGLHRVLKNGRSAVVVNGWRSPLLMVLLNAPVRLRKSLRKFARRILGREASQEKKEAVGTFIDKYDAAWLKHQLEPTMNLEILAWRSVNTHFTRFYIHDRLGGRWILRLIYWLEERFPHFFGENGAYPMIVIKKHTP